MKVLCALSGGVDSAVAALLLKQRGHDVTGVFVINYDDGGSCWNADYQDAVRVAAKIGIPIITFDFQEEYRKKVLDYMFSEYEKNRTPNPDILCNKFIKFGSWLQKAQDLGFDMLATGHYARNAVVDGMHSLQKAFDSEKDQTYFLSSLSQYQLSHTIFPLGEYTKKQVRAIARENDLLNADKEESMGICFVGEVPMKEFLMKKIMQTPGDIVDTSGNMLGTHDGLPFYTIGQRNLHISSDRPLYVLRKDGESNTLIVGHDDDPLMMIERVVIENIHFISGQQPQFPIECEVRLRHRQQLQSCTLSEKYIIFKQPQRAVTPGQFAVFYKDQQCIGNAVIHSL